MKPHLIPVPRRIEYHSGFSRIDTDTSVSVLHDAALPEEGYVLTVSDDAVTILSSSSSGEYYARQTLAQIIATCSGECDNLTITDHPVMGYRSFLIDSCRHFYGVVELKLLINVAAKFKMNKFHWHLTDDQGWRIEIKKYPQLTAIGGTRSNSRFGGIDEKKPHKGYFTQGEIREIVDYCTARQIEVIPEIEMPGHFTAAIASYPFLGCTGKEMEPEQKEGVFPNVMCVGNEDAVRFVKNVLDEVVELFPGRYIHIGGDEAPRTSWQSCEKCTAKMKRLGLSDFDALQGSFIKEIASYLKDKGKISITWNESLKGNRLLPGDVVVQRWMDRKGLTSDYAKCGGKVIESDFYHYYLDYPYGMTPLKKTYGYDPFSPVDASSVTGVECCLWTEFVRTFDDLCEKLFPRLTAVAERGWSGYPARPYCEYRCAFETLMQYVKDEGIPLLPEDRWDPGIKDRLKEVVSFFKGSLNAQALRQAIDSQK